MTSYFFSRTREWRQDRDTFTLQDSTANYRSLGCFSSDAIPQDSQFICWRVSCFSVHRNL